MITKKKAEKLLLHLSLISKVDILLRLKERGKMRQYEFDKLQEPDRRKKLKLLLKNLQRGLSEVQGNGIPKTKKPYAIVSDTYAADRAIQDYASYFKAELFVKPL